MIFLEDFQGPEAKRRGLTQGSGILWRKITNGRERESKSSYIYMQAKIGSKKKKKRRERTNQDKHVCEPESNILYHDSDPKG